MFHIELRQFPHAARVFNWTREEVDERILGPLAAGRAVELDDRRWSPEKVKVAIYEGPELEIEGMGMGRGWGNATKAGEDVTARLFAEARAAIQSPPALDGLKEAIVARTAERPLGMDELLRLASELAADVDANQRVALAARATWELLGEGRVSLAGPAGAP